MLLTPPDTGASGAAESSAPVPRRVAQEAVRWWTALQAESLADSQRHAWQRWRAAHPEHERAWRRIEAVSASLGTVPAPVALAAVSVPQGAGRRQALRALSLAVMGGSGLWLAREVLPWQPWVADYGTGVGERRPLTLSDGSQIVLNALTALDVVFDASWRALHLAQGEILVETAPDGAGRPFVVHAPEGTIRAIGTRFVVRRDDQGVAVSVLQGAVSLHPVRAPMVQRTLQAGQSGLLTYTDTQATDRDATGTDSWVRGVLVASRMPLGRFLREVGRYRHGHIGCDPAVAGWRVSGSYPLHDTDRILASLPEALPVEVHTHTRYWVTVRARTTEQV